MYGLLATVMLLASAKANVNVTTDVGGSGSVESHIETSVNGNTTSVESTLPGTIRVEKTDTGETIKTLEATPSYVVTSINTKTLPNWISLLYSLWDRVKKLIRFERLTEK